MFFGTDRLTSTAKVVQRWRFSFFREAHNLYSRQADRSMLSDEFANVIIFSDEFYQEAMSHPIPTDLEVVKLLAPTAALDLYVWLSYRCFTAKGEESVPIFGPRGLLQHIGSVECSCARRFRAKLEEWLRTIRLIWPECPARISADRRYIVVNHAISVHSFRGFD
jgi:hypothetical protein